MLYDAESLYFLSFFLNFLFKSTKSEFILKNLILKFQFAFCLIQEKVSLSIGVLSASRVWLNDFQAQRILPEEQNIDLKSLRQTECVGWGLDYYSLHRNRKNDAF